MARGRAVCFEAKHTDTGKIAQTSVTPEQTEALDTHFDMGAICFVVVSLGMQDFYRVPWEIWRDMKKQFGHKYMNPEELERYRLMTDRGNILFLD
jgi:recombination protein U